MFRSVALGVVVVVIGVGLVMTQDGGRPVVEVAQGRVVGVVKEYNNYSYNAFLAIPYAMPPVGERRFKVRTRNGRLVLLFTLSLGL